MANENQIIRVVNKNGKPFHSIAIYTSYGDRQLVEWLWQLISIISDLKDEDLLLHKRAIQFKNDLAFRLNIQVEVVVDTNRSNNEN